MMLEHIGNLVPMVGGCMKTVQRIDSWMKMNKSVCVHKCVISILLPIQNIIS